MSLTVVHDRNRVEYQALSTDVTSGSIQGATWIGAKVILTDTGQEYLVATDFQLEPYVADTGGYTTATETVITTGSVSGSLVAANASRKYLLIDNHSSSETIYISTSASATTSSTHIVADGNYEMIDNSLYRGALTVVKSGSQIVTVSILEGI